MDAAWQILDQQLQRIAAGESSDLSEQDVNQFAEIYAAHMEREEAHIAPMATRVLSTEQMTQLGNAMRNRRGIA
jgi:hemerythrin-like domain-containing protein